MSSATNFAEVAGRSAQATATIYGSPNYPGIGGTVLFYQLPQGVAVMADIHGLPKRNQACVPGIHGFHIHAGASCSGTAAEPFANANGHYNPGNCPHPAHAGDLPPLFATATGQAWSMVLLDRFTIDEVMGRTVIIHSQADDFTSQPAGNSGQMIACGVIR